MKVTMMPVRPTFWIALAVAELLFGAAIFFSTRAYYRADSAASTMRTPAAVPQGAPAWPTASGTGLAPADTFSTGLAVSDPTVLSRQADEAFGNRQYAQAADLYARLLGIDPGNVEVINNLGITLHYLGRSAEALTRLNEGIGIDPTHQRSWLTTGFINAQIGNVEDARMALSNAVMLGPETDVGQSAAQMLQNLPQ
jgi:tetratricopeptide (TPR) repeat protein